MNHLTDLKERPDQVTLKKATRPLRFQKKAQQTEKGNEIWLTTLADLFMLLMVCFVLLFGMMIYQEKETTASQEPNHKEVMEAATAGITPQNQTVLASKEFPSSLESDLLGMLGHDQDQQTVTIERRSQYIVLTFPEHILFESGKANVKSSAQSLLGKVVSALQNHRDLFVEVEGYTDDRPIHNQRYSSNWELSVDRATQVARPWYSWAMNLRRFQSRVLRKASPLLQ